MGLTFLIILVITSILAGRMLVKARPEILNWSLNKKQALVIGWFILSVFICLGIFSLWTDFAIENFLFNSIGISLIMGMAFNFSLKTKKEKTP
ncbi:hypothetical protein [Acinetobacter gerneri]|jgi:hypothetical protein|uniref:hypothetical protein n=1 Tax=Acinetobacter gerneri TaxID=202952 RepID=UPI0023F4923D|nr:hypothetical protein [Acinetobacter gerneri]MCH4243342.1 hypothetical protein [Acinetobacter gerneri]